MTIRATGRGFVTAKQVAEMMPAEVQWAVRPWVAIGGITELSGRIKWSGKTTLALAMSRVTLDGADFMGEPTHKGAVVYLTEQPLRSFREALRRANLLDREDFHVLSWADAGPLTWAQVVEAATAKALEVEASLLVVDTLGWWAGIRGDDENSTGAAQSAMEPLVQAAGADKFGLLVLRHERKGGGEVGESARGSTAFGGSVDVVLALKRPEGNTMPTLRVIDALSRFDETPDTMMIELTDQGYIAHGNVQALAAHTAREVALQALENESKGLSLEELLSKDMIKSKAITRSTLQRVLEELAQSGEVQKTGQGVRGQPYRYAKILSAHIESVVWAESNSDSSSLTENLLSADDSTDIVSAQTSHLRWAETNHDNQQREIARAYDRKATLPNGRPPLEVAQERLAQQIAARQ